MLFEKVLCWSMVELLFTQHEKTNRVYKSMKQCRQMTPLCCVGTVGVGWGGSSLERGVNISNASPKYLQPERMISGSCNYPPGYHPSEPTSGQSIVLGFPSILAYLNDESFISCHSSQ